MDGPDASNQLRKALYAFPNVKGSTPRHLRKRRAPIQETGKVFWVGTGASCPPSKDEGGSSVSAWTVEMTEDELAMLERGGMLSAAMGGPWVSRWGEVRVTEVVVWLGVSCIVEMVGEWPSVVAGVGSGGGVGAT